MHINIYIYRHVGRFLDSTVTPKNNSHYIYVYIYICRIYIYTHILLVCTHLVSWFQDVPLGIVRHPGIGMTIVIHRWDKLLIPEGFLIGFNQIHGMLQWFLSRKSIAVASVSNWLCSVTWWFGSAKPCPTHDLIQRKLALQLQLPVFSHTVGRVWGACWVHQIYTV